MKSLKWTILTPVLLLVVLVPIITLIFFNVSMRVYVQKTFRTELNAASLSIEKLAKQELSNINGNPDSAQLEAIADKISQRIKNPKVLSSTEILFFSGGKLIYQENGDDLGSVLFETN